MDLVRKVKMLGLWPVQMSKPSTDKVDYANQK